MAENGNGSRYPSWKVVASALASIMLLLVVAVVSDTRSGVSEARTKIECLQKEKLDKEQYREDMAEIRSSLRDINRKLDAMRR